MSIKLVTESEKTEQDDIILMNEMKPLEVCVVMGGPYTGHIVIRTASSNNFEVMDLTESDIDSAWCGDAYIKVQKVRRLRKGEKYLLELS
jgi:hypothetical protein